ncbi:MAG: hypothetical protein IJ284_00840 [Clostridia bacterium]|nr:hypothetical protein [Clostridia bacterium]
MNVKDIVLAAAQSLGIKTGVSAYFDSGDTACEREAELLLSCFNLVESGLALDYLPLYAEDTLRSANGKVEFSSFAYSPVRILDVTDSKGNAVAYTLYAKYLKAQSGTLKITYTYTPNKKGIDEESDFDLLTGDHVFVYGVLAEYCLAENMFEEAAAWDKKFKDSIEVIFHTRKCQRLSSRRWV